MGIRTDIKAEIKRVKALMRANEREIDKGNEDPWLLTDRDIYDGKLEGLELALEIIDKYTK